jgi:HprK-related kinase A
MDAKPAQAGPTLGSIDSRTLRKQFATEGVRLDLGAMRARIHTPFADLADAIGTVYGDMPCADGPGFDDVTVEVVPTPGLKGRLRPSLRFLADGLDPFGAQDRAFALPALEWGLNWCFATQFNRHLLLHAGVVDIQGRGLVLAGTPGAGKSTLTAALAMAGHRPLSDEFGILRLVDGMLLPLPKPIALKNRSIDVARARWPGATLGPVHHKTHKGDVAHLAMPARSLAMRDVPVRPSVVVLPRWSDGSAPLLRPVSPPEAIAQLTSNSFNADMLGVVGFDAIRAVVDACSCWALDYSELDDAIAVLEQACRDHA